ncbi:MoaF C-terminal domain-containing protein [Nocardiopsis mangrovi]|uniref:MoaF C-terminal domain-containing protein n=1 Tax=Nocardiopsis mangrovi TaxID=1179818 RepID=A0ABV9E108_9ACTN
MPPDSSSAPDLRSLYLSYEFCDAGFDGNRLPLSDRLAGTGQVLFAPGASSPGLRVDFTTGTELTWQDGEGAPQRSAYRAVEVRPGVFYVDWSRPGDRSRSVSLVLDVPGARASVLRSALPGAADARAGLYERILDRDDLSAVDVDVRGMGIGRPPPADPHPRSTDLVGRRVLCAYGSSTLEHVYLNEHLFCWHVVSGGGAGAADVDPCAHYRIADDLYLLVWREKLAPAVGMVLLDFARRRSTGKLFYDRLTEPGTITDYLVGAELTVLNHTRYP